MDVVIDFETRSLADLPVVGVDNYTDHPSTDILCMAAEQMGTGIKWLWTPDQETLPDSLVTAIHAAPSLMAHNARFDQLIWEKVAVSDYGFPTLPLEKWSCSAARCRVNALPSALDKAARATCGARKDHTGTALIKKLSIPDENGKFNNDPILMRQMYAYCHQDVTATVGVINATRPMTPTEQADWLRNEEINDRGVLVDTYLATLVVPYAQQEQLEIADQLADISQGAVTKHTQAVRFKDFLLDVLGHRSDVLKVMRRPTKDGKERFSADKAVRAELLELPDIPTTVQELISLMNDGNKSSVAKFRRMTNLAGYDDRVRGCFYYAGAGQTKRTSSKGLQMQNMVRDCCNADETEEIIDKMEAGEKLPSVMQTLSKLLRPALVPAEGKTFVVGDWSAIEGMVLPWLANSAGAEKALDVFRRGEDPYVHTATSMGLDDRLIGKVAMLALGFAGGVGAFNAMAKVYGLKMSDYAAQRIVDKWRYANKWAVRFWKQTEQAARYAIKTPNRDFKAGRLSYCFHPELLSGTLVCTLPSGETIQYPHTKFGVVDHPKFGKQMSMTYAKASLTPAADAEEWPRGQLYSSILVENATQAVAGEILREALHEINNVVLTVHDEVVCEVPVAQAEQALLELESTMETPPAWAPTLPLKAKPVIMHRYGK